MLSPPLPAERLLSWSLSTDDRSVILGDCQEEFIAIAENSGVEAANRWYWRQALQSVAPNLLRQLRQQWASARAIVDEADRRSRRTRLIVGMCLTGFLLTVGGLMSTFVPNGFAWVLIWITPGLATMLSSRYRVGQGYRSRRAFVRDTAYIAAMLLQLFYRREAGAFWLVFGIATIWPEAVWPFRRTADSREWYFRSPVFTYPDSRSGAYQLVSVPAAAMSMGNLVLGLSDSLNVPSEYRVEGLKPMSITVARSFRPDKTLRLFAVVNADPADVDARLEVHRASTGRPIASFPAVVTPATALLPARERFPRNSDVERPRLPSTPAANLDVEIALAGLTPDQYVLRLVADVADRSTHRDVHITVKPPIEGRR